ncbi:MAG: ATP-binding protein [Desulfamplus sp.]|nr:ATP-binding protein [Desulfamplus sp.]
MTHPATLPILLRQLHLSTMGQLWESMLVKADAQQWNGARYLAALCEEELNERHSRKIARFTKESKLPVGKTLETFNFDYTPNVNRHKINALTSNGEWVDRATNVLFFGPSGVGKTHLAAALCYGLIQKSIRVRYYSATALVQQMQKARQELKLEQFFTKLDNYSVILLDDIGYVKKSESESHVLFELIAHRYETGSLIITSNQPFSEWDNIFTDSSMTVAAIDRVVHHSIIIEVEAESYRKRQAIDQNNTP